MNTLNLRKKVLFTFSVLTFLIVVVNLLAPFISPLLQILNETFALLIITVEVCLWCIAVIPSIILQRFHCAHFCAMSGVFELAAIVTKSKDVMKTEYPKALKYVMPSVWIASFVFVAIQYSAFRFSLFTVAPIYTYLRVTIYYALFALSAVLSMTFGKSNTAHYICPFSPWMLSLTKLNRRLHLPTLAVITDSSKCAECMLCSKSCMIGDNVYRKVKEGTFNQVKCMNCLDCTKVCKTGAIQLKMIRK